MVTYLTAGSIAYHMLCYYTETEATVSNEAGHIERAAPQTGHHRLMDSLNRPSLECSISIYSCSAV